MQLILSKLKTHATHKCLQETSLQKCLSVCTRTEDPSSKDTKFDTLIPHMTVTAATTDATDLAGRSDRVRRTDKPSYFRYYAMQ